MAMKNVPKRSTKTKPEHTEPRQPLSLVLEIPDETKLTEPQRLGVTCIRIVAMCRAAVNSGDKNACAEIRSGLEAVELVVRRILAGGGK